MNRLQYENSPYLLQHKTNPVNWYPWSEEAFKRARGEDKPVFLSIGYSTCHWCHVMEKESFEDEEVAALLNEHFVSIKVDREERPDIDHIYMQACQVMKKQGGWPLTVFMSHTKEPFFIATYIPKESRHGRVGMMQFLPHITDLWKNKRQDITNAANQITDILERLENQDHRGEANLSLVDQAVKDLSERFDAKNGGFSNAPKFPTPHVIAFLLRESRGSKESEHLKSMAKQTLNHLARGGIYDHIGYGFHRYSTDGHWLVPHFEKMLYDQAMLLFAYTEYFLVTRDSVFSEVTEQITRYVVRNLKNEEGGFFCAEDADSEGEEGKFYVWDHDELKTLLSQKELRLAEQAYGIQEGGNFLDEATRRPSLKNIFHLTMDRFGKDAGFFTDDVRSSWEALRKKLFLEREKKIHPHKDDKILADWNGLMIAALARAASAVGARTAGENVYLEEAKKAMSFVLENMQDEDKHLLHFHRNGASGVTGYLDDYSHIIWALVELYEASFDVHYLEEAIRLTDTMIRLFWDEENDAFFFTPQSSERLLLRNKEWYDGALPSGNSVACYILARLSELTGDPSYKDRAFRLVNAGYEIFKNFTSGYSFMMMSLSYLLGDHTQVVILCKNLEDAREAISKMQAEYDPLRTIMVVEESTRQRYASIAKFTKNMKILNQKVTAYVCKNFICNQPMNF